MSHRNSLLVALNAAKHLHRGAICQLGLHLDDWTGTPPRGAAAKEEEARRLGIPAAQLKAARQIAAQARTLAAAETDRAAEAGTRILTHEDPDYPKPLRDLQLPPPVLYVAGELTDEPAVAIVGSRKSSRYGESTAHLFARGLAEAGVSVISGFARGIDAAAHRAALEPENGRTLAILGCGIDIPYPSRHGDLRQAIRQRGALVSEFPFGAEPRRWSFPIRNRVIAALSSGTLVIQAGARSGSLITAHHAMELGREVWAVPGPIFEENSQGPHHLIRDGAGLVQHPRDILEMLRPPRRLPLALSPPVSSHARALPSGAAGKILKRIPPGEDRSPDALAEETGLPIHNLLAELLDLELNGWLRRLPGPAYRRILE